MSWWEIYAVVVGLTVVAVLCLAFWPRRSKELSATEKWLAKHEPPSRLDRLESDGKAS
jgi:hypothetical protein